MARDLSRFHTLRSCLAILKKCRLYLSKQPCEKQFCLVTVKIVVKSLKSMPNFVISDDEQSIDYLY